MPRIPVIPSHPSQNSGKLWELIKADLFTTSSSNFLCIVEYHSRFQIVKQTDILSAESLITCCKTVFAEYGLPRKMALDVGINFVSGKLKEFCRTLNTE